MSAVLTATGCYIPHPRFGADNFWQEKDTDGVPTYTGTGSIGYDEKPEPYAAKVVATACPDGNPVVVDGFAIADKGTDKYGFPVSGKYWSVTFTCTKAIPGLTPSDE
jgi:hypothetical protein